MSNVGDFVDFITEADLDGVRLVVLKGGLTMPELDELYNMIGDSLPKGATMLGLPPGSDLETMTDEELDLLALVRRPSPSGPTSEQLLPDDHDRGIYRKYRVTVERVDGRSGPGQKHEDCEFFVLDLEHDPFALPALDAYARHCDGEFPFLAEGIRAKLRELISPKDGWEMPEAPLCPRHNRIKARPAVHNTGDGWAIGWDATCCGPDEFAWDDGGPGIGEIIEWPFKVNWARSEDWIRLGFIVV